MAEPQKKDILVVDDEKQVLIILNHVLKKAFNVKMASSGDEAYELIKNGYEPGVIISDLMMPGMNGTEFLKKSIEFVPNATRIIITANHDPKMVISCINKAHAFMFLKKPFDNLELFQVAVVAYEKYESILKLRELENSTIILDEKQKIDDDSAINTKELIAQNDNLNKLINEKDKIILDSSEEINSIKSRLNQFQTEIEEFKTEIEDSNKKIEQLDNINDESKSKILSLSDNIKTLQNELDINNSFPRESALGLSTFIREMEHFWFVDHTYSVAVIVKALTKELELNEVSSFELITAALLHNFTICAMPDSLKAANPNLLQDETQEVYFKYFQKAINIFKKIRKIDNSVQIISQMWEHLDGSGYPKGIHGQMFKQESQILALANTFNTNIYGFTDEQFIKNISDGYVVQTPAETSHRYKATMKSIYKSSRWFDRNIFDAFINLVKYSEIKELMPSKEHLTVKNKNKSLTDSSTMSPSLTLTSSKNDEHDLDLKFKDSELEDKTKVVIMEIEPIEIKIGMKLAQNIFTISGMNIAKSETELTPEIVKKIQQFDMKDMIDGTIAIYVEIEDFS